MENLHRLKTDALVDMLSIQTDEYFRIQIEGSTEEQYAKCKLFLKAIQKELDFRTGKDRNINTSNEEMLAE